MPILPGKGGHTNRANDMFYGKEDVDIALHMADLKYTPGYFQILFLSYQDRKIISDGLKLQSWLLQNTWVTAIIPNCI